MSQAHRPGVRLGHYLRGSSNSGPRVDSGALWLFPISELPRHLMVIGMPGDCVPVHVQVSRARQASCSPRLACNDPDQNHPTRLARAPAAHSEDSAQSPS